MILFLYGPDDFRLNQKIKEIALGYKKVHTSSLSIEKLDADQVSFDEFLDILNQQSMFVNKKLLFVENVFSVDQFKKELTKKIDQILTSEYIIVLIQKGEVKKNNKLFKTLEEKAKCQYFESLKGIRLKNWVSQEFSKLGANIDALALDKLINRVGSDMWLFSSSINKLASYSKQISSEHIDLFVQPKFDSEIFKTIDAIAQGNKKRALQLIEAHLRNGDSPLYLLSMVNYQFRNLALVKQGKPKSMHPFVFSKTSALASRFSQEKIKRIFNQILKTNLDIKTGRLMPEPALRTLILAI